MRLTAQPKKPEKFSTRLALRLTAKLFSFARARSERLLPACTQLGRVESGPSLGILIQVGEKLRARLNAADHQPVTGAGAGDVKQLSLGLVYVIELDLVGDSFNA